MAASISILLSIKINYCGLLRSQSVCEGLLLHLFFVRRQTKA